VSAISAEDPLHAGRHRRAVPSQRCPDL